MADVLPIRERALERLVAVLNAQVEGAPEADPVRRAYSFDWKHVQRTPLNDADRREENAIAVLEGVETVVPGAGWNRRTLSVTLDFRYFMRSGDPQATIFNRVLGELQRRIREDRTLGGFVEDIRELQNAPDVDDDNDIQIGGQLFISVIYKVSENDPAVFSAGAAVPADPSPALP